MPTKINSAGEQQEYVPKGESDGGQYLGDDTNKTQWITTDRNYSKLQPKIVELSDDNDLGRLIASSDENKYKVITKYIISNYGGNDILFPDGYFAKIDNSDAKELAHKADKKRTAEISLLNDLIESSSFVNEIQLQKEEHNKFEAFRYYLTKTRYKDKVDEIWLNVGKARNSKDDEWHFYAITKKETLPID